jgi:hypothetical protein
MTVQEFVNIDKDLQTVQDISDVNIIILIYLFSSTTFLWQLIKLQILLRIKSTNVITGKVNTGNYSNQNNWSPVPTLNYEINDCTMLYCQTRRPPSATGFQTQKS